MSKYGAVMVTGGRKFNKTQIIFSVLDRLKADNQVNLLVNGGRPGAERISFEWGIRNIPGRITTYCADRYGYSSGVIPSQIVRIDRRMLFISVDEDYESSFLIDEAIRAGHDVKRVSSSLYSWWLE